jgi:urea transport system substrate-binding protein
VGPAIDRIRQTGPDVVINTINGGTNVVFFQELRKAGYTPGTLPTLSVSITENEVKGLMPAALAGDYLAASYFQTIARPESREFIRRLRAQYGREAVATDQMAGAYCGVHLWAGAVRAAGSPGPAAVLAAVRGRAFDGPRARVRIDPANLHTWLPVHIGRIRPDGLVDVLPGVGSAVPIAPVPVPPTRTPEQWDEFLRGLWFGWNGKWQAPDEK